MAEFLEFGGEEGDAGFEVGEARFEGLMGGGVTEHHLDGGAGHFGDAGKAVGKAEFAEAVMFFAREPEADHVATGFEGHGGETHRNG